MTCTNTQSRTFSLENLPLTSSYQKYKKNTESAINSLNQAINTNQIYNPIFQEIKSTFGNIVYNAWCSYILEPYFYGGKYKELPEEISEITNASSPSSLHDIFALKKRIDKRPSTHPAAEHMRKFVAEFFPIATAMNDLKPHIIKGRQPNQNPKPENPNKIIQICACCFRAIAINPDQTMVHHGYKRPGDGYQTTSCPGIHFKSLDVSPEGLDWLIAENKKYLTKLQKKLAGKDKWIKLQYVDYKKMVIEIISDHPKWEHQKKIMIANLESEIRSLSRTIKEHMEIRENWKAKD